MTYSDHALAITQAARLLVEIVELQDQMKIPPALRGTYSFELSEEERAIVKRAKEALSA